MSLQWFGLALHDGRGPGLARDLPVGAVLPLLPVAEPGAVPAKRITGN